MLKNEKKNLKTLIKTRKTLIEDKTSSHNMFSLPQIWFLPEFTEAAAEVERNRIKYWPSSKIHRYFLKTNMFKVITDTR